MVKKHKNKKASSSQNCIFFWKTGRFLTYKWYLPLILGDEGSYLKENLARF